MDLCRSPPRLPVELESPALFGAGHIGIERHDDRMHHFAIDDLRLGNYGFFLRDIEQIHAARCQLQVPTAVSQQEGEIDPAVL